MTSGRVTLHRFADVDAALRCADVVVPGTETSHDKAHTVVRRSVRQSMALDALFDERELFVALLRDRIDTLLTSGSRCFAADVARPWALTVTSRLLRRTPACVEQGAPLAATVFEAAAHSADGESLPAARAAAVALYQLLTSAPPEPAADSAGNAAAVQAFVALTQSLPALMANALHALLSHPEQYAWLRAQPHVPAKRTVHELLRFATPSRAVYRRAVRDTTIGDHAIAAGDLVVLQLAAANRDPARFTNPDSLQLTAERAPHVSFGAGAHHCSGAAVVETLLECLVEALATSPVTLALSSPPDVRWMDGVAVRAPVRLMVEIGA